MLDSGWHSVVELHTSHCLLIAVNNQWHPALLASKWVHSKTSEPHLDRAGLVLYPMELLRDDRLLRTGPWNRLSVRRSRGKWSRKEISFFSSMGSRVGWSIFRSIGDLTTECMQRKKHKCQYGDPLFGSPLSLFFRRCMDMFIYQREVDHVNRLADGKARNSSLLAFIRTAPFAQVCSMASMIWLLPS